MKARVKATGEIVEVYQSSYNAGEFYDTETGTETYDVSELELLGTIIPIATEEIPDYWTRLKHQAAIAAMKELLPQVNDGYEYVHEETAIVAYNYANALIELLKKEERK